MKTASAPAKAILLGEHSSLYGNPALAMAIDLRAKVTVSVREDEQVNITAPGLGLENAPVKRNQRGTALVKRAARIYPGGYDISIESKIPLASGLGSSAAISAALIWALDALNKKGSHMRSAPEVQRLCEPQDSHMRFLQEEAQLCESEVHSKSSGLDTAASIYGGVIKYQNGVAEKLEIENFPRLVIAHSGVESDTAEIVKAIEEINLKEPERMKFFLDESERLVFLGETALKAGDWEGLGKEMTENHRLLGKMGVSSIRMDALVDAALNAGAYGAKLCGAGRGGIMAALVDEKSENGVKEALSRLDAKIIEEGICKKGVSLE